MQPDLHLSNHEQAGVGAESIDTAPHVFTPGLTLQTLTRGDGLLGMLPHGAFGPRGASVTIARLDWLYTGGPARGSHNMIVLDASVAEAEQGGSVHVGMVSVQIP